ncbi:type II secretion system F family protein [Nocardioides massiliensis]|uniref:Tight adherence protein C n=1 Tax=Nocardioides massiliensis TaxID=1325935 RepID=A0ABT9NJ41_9ACTN|nr:type II secretion system F family protein [Nocardioides massiliensis]MDP9820435.1 tight adherence protein C [Nocardioides massiliensis]
MSPAVWGALLGAVAGGALLVVLDRVAALGRPRLEQRVLPYLRDLPARDTVIASGTDRPISAARAVFGPSLTHAADLVERVLGGADSVRRRLDRAGSDMTVHDFRVSQVMWGLVAFAGTAAVALLVSLRSPDRAVPMLIACVLAFAIGVLLRENRLTAQVRQREERMLAEFPTVAELLALAVAAGEGPVQATARVAGRTNGELARELERVLAAVRTGTPVTRALDDLAARTGLPVLARFAEGMAVAIERGTPLTDVLHAQAADVREARRRALIESGARREVLMMAPVVFLVLPTVVFFVFFPGVVGLRLFAP